MPCQTTQTQRAFLKPFQIQTANQRGSDDHPYLSVETGNSICLTRIRQAIGLRRAPLGRALAFYHVLVWLAVPTLPTVSVSGWRLPVGDTSSCKEKSNYGYGGQNKALLSRGMYLDKEANGERESSKITLSLIHQSTHAALQFHANLADAVNLSFLEYLCTGRSELMSLLLQ
jgi:hypothetical protein